MSTRRMTAQQRQRSRPVGGALADPALEGQFESSSCCGCPAYVIPTLAFPWSSTCSSAWHSGRAASTYNFPTYLMHLRAPSE